MEFYDISREFFSTPPYAGDPPPTKRRIQDMADEEAFTLSAYTATAHSATHVDAPLHYVLGGDDISSLPLNPFVGGCTVIELSGEITGEQAEQTLRAVKEKRVLIKGNGNAFLSQSAAFAFASEGVELVGTDAPSIARPGNDAKPHKELLGAGVPILENLNLHEIEPGNYFLVAVPIKMAGMEGAPVRAILLRGISIF